VVVSVGVPLIVPRLRRQTWPKRNRQSGQSLGGRLADSGCYDGLLDVLLLAVEAYERAESERQILKLLARGEREIATGKGHDLDAVLAEADRLLSEP
jgi:hypothetical protein